MLFCLPLSYAPGKTSIRQTMSERYGDCPSCFKRGGIFEECLRCGGTGYDGSLDAQWLVPRKKEKEVRPDLMQRALAAFETHTQPKRKIIPMNTPIVPKPHAPVTLTEKFGYTEKQLDLIKRTVAKNATDDELELFFYRCTELKLNPLLPGQVYFLKFKNRKTGEWNPGTVVIGIDGFRVRAGRTGKHNGTKRGVIRDANGVCIGGWADVYRKDWDHPAHVEVSMKEYADPYKDTWREMPESMIQKTAEVAALRMAFPEELGGMYTPEEMDQANRPSKEIEAEIIRKPSEAQLKRLFAISKAAGKTHDEVKDILKQNYKKESSKDLTLDEYNELCDWLQKKEVTPTSPQDSPDNPGWTEDHGGWSDAKMLDEAK